MKKWISLIVFAGVLGLLSSWLIFTQVHAQSDTQDGLIDAFTFFIPYSVDRLDEQFNAGRITNTITITRIETIISIAVHLEGTIIYYDHWEDGLELDLTNPTQFSTQVWGDDDPTNGIPPLYDHDVLNSDSTILLRNLVPVDFAERDPNNSFLFDGGDILTGGGGSLAVTLTFWPQGPGILYTDAWELYPTNRWGMDYIVPVGENLAGLRPGFTKVGLNVQAVKDGTNVVIDANGDGTVDTTLLLDYGEQYNTISGLNASARLQASAPVQVHLFATDPVRTYEARGYSPVPVIDWTDDYLAPRSSDGDFWIYNPDPTTALNVLAQTISNTTVITVPAKSTAKFPASGLSAATGVRFTSTDGRPFYGLVALDEADAQDWGYALLPVDYLTTQMLIGLGLGNNNNPGPPPDPDGNESRVYVTALAETTVFVDYDNDGAADASFPITPLVEVPITDPDNDLTGAFIYTTNDVPFAAVWGQDASAPPAQPSIDAGTGIVPLHSLLIQKSFKLSRDADCNGLISPDDTVRFKLEYFNNSINPIPNVILVDMLPSALNYVPNSIVLNGVSVPDGAGGTSLFEPSGYNVRTLDGRTRGSLTFEAVVTPTGAAIVNRAEARSQDLPLGADTVSVFVPTGAIPPLLQLNFALVQPVNGIINGSQTITFGLTITNTGSATITKLPVENRFSEDYLTFRSAVPPPNMTASGVVTWSDLTTIFGQLPPGGVVNLLSSYVVDQIPPTPDDIFNEMTVLEARRSDSPLALICIVEADVSIAVPTPTEPPGGGDTPVPPTGTPFITPPATPTRTPPSTVTGTPPATVTGTPPPPVSCTPPPSLPGLPPTTPIPCVTPEVTGTVMPVISLPETGTQNLQLKDVRIGGAIFLLVLVGGSILALSFRQRSK